MIPKPKEVAEIHRGLCQSAGCQFLDKLNYNDPCIGCPENHFGPYMRAGCADRGTGVSPVIPKDPGPGLGHKIAAIATPIARFLKMPCVNQATKQLKPESGCAKMKDRLNAGMPMGHALKKRLKGE
jgi:hypothetical protein